MKILILIDTFYPVVGGISNVVDNSAECLSKFADVTVGAVKCKNYDDPETSYKILRCNGYWSKLTGDGFAQPAFDKQFVKTIMNEKFDIVHVHTAGNLMNFAYKLRKKLHIPVVTTIHTEYFKCTKDIVKFNWLAKLITKFLLHKTYKADYVWTVSQTFKQRLNGYLTPKKPIEVIRNCTNLINNISEDEINKFDKNQTRFLFVGRLVKIKNFDLIIDSVNILKTQNLNFVINVLGDGDEKNNILNRIKHLGLEKYFVFHGIIDDDITKSMFYKESDVILFPSLAETAGLIQNEAAAFLKPTIAINNTAQAEEIIDGFNGLKCEPAPQEFAYKMLFAINNHEKIKEMGASAQKTIYKPYNDEYAQNIINLYKSYISQFNTNLSTTKNKNLNFNKNKIEE